MKKWNILDLVGEDCITIEDGEKVYDLIHPELRACRPVELDFIGVEIFAAPFFDAAIGRLLEDITPENLKHLLKVSNLVHEEVEALELLIEDSARYYRDPIFRQAVDEVMLEQAEEH